MSSNHLQNLSMSNLVASQVNLLDISGNPNLLVSSHDLDGVKYVSVKVLFLNKHDYESKYDGENH